MRLRGLRVARVLALRDTASRASRGYEMAWPRRRRGPNVRRRLVGGDDNERCAGAGGFRAGGRMIGPPRLSSSRVGATRR